MQRARRRQIKTDDDNQLQVWKSEDALQQVRGDARQLRVSRSLRAFSNQDVRRLLLSPEYNSIFAGGRQNGPVPRPLFSPGKASFAYKACSGTVNTSFALTQGMMAMLIVTPQSATPITVFYNLNPTDQPFLPDYNTYTDNAVWGTGTGTALATPWIGGVDPRSLVTGHQGMVTQDPGTKPLLQQFMGGRIMISAVASLTAAGRVAIVDSKSYPTIYGAKLSPYDASSITPSSGLTNYVIPDQEDMLRYYRPTQAFASMTVSDMASQFRVATIMGASNQATVHCPFVIPPDGQMWCAFSGHNVIGENGNACIGGVPYQNTWGALCMGYPIYFVENTGLTAMNFQISGEFAYNVEIDPLYGPGPLLAIDAPVAAPHTSTVTKMHSVPVLEHDMHVAHSHHVDETIKSSHRAGLTDASKYVVGVAPVTPAPAKPRDTVGEAISHGVESLAEKAGDFALQGLQKVASGATDAIGSLLSSIF